MCERFVDIVDIGEVSDCTSNNIYIYKIYHVFYNMK